MIIIYNIEASTIEDNEIYDNFFDFLDNLRNILGLEDEDEVL